VAVGWIFSPLWKGTYNQRLDEDLTTKDPTTIEKKVDIEPNNSDLSYKESFYSEVNSTLQFKSFDLIIKSIKTNQNKATITYELLNQENYISDFIIFKMVDEFGNEAYHRRNFIVENGQENTAILDIDMLDDRANYLELYIENITGGYLQPIGKMTNEPLIFISDNTEYKLEYSPITVSRNRAILSSNSSMTLKDLPLLGYVKDGITGDFYSKNGRTENFILTKLQVEKAVGENYDYQDESTLLLIQKSILEEKNRVVDIKELSQALEELADRDYITVLATMPIEFTETVLEAYKISDIEGATIGILKPDDFLWSTVSIKIDLAMSN
jgi:hypothetical protein